MFGNLHTMGMPALPQEPPKNVPPATPINFPQCAPRVEDNNNATSGSPSEHVCTFLQKIIRPTEVNISHLEAVGVHVISDVSPADLIPDPAYIPDFVAWEALSEDAVHDTNDSTRKPLNSGGMSPGCKSYLERKTELSITNNAAFRAVRRIPVPPGQTQARLGNSYEFFRHLELISTFWEDTSKLPEDAEEPKLEETKKDGDDGGSTSGDSKAPETKPLVVRFYRTGAGHQMPPEYRYNIVAAFLKLVAYDFGCNVSNSRTEPRLFLTSMTPTNIISKDPASSSSSSSEKATSSKKGTSFPSQCTFIFRTPKTREAARAGIVEGPLAAVTTRNTVLFPPAPTDSSDATSSVDRDSVIDLGREIIAALITAQHRAREGKTEQRIGEGEWWTTKPRWGGGPGGPIGREVEMAAGLDVEGDKDAPPPSRPAGSGPSASSARLPILSSQGPGASSSRDKNPKRQKKSGNLPMYDNYRIVRAPAATWDRKTRYEAIGRKRGANYDDVFVVSSLFHHVSVLRVRVPDRLLEVLEGAADDESVPGRLSWGRLEVRRSRWFDLFKAEDRVEGMQLVWSMMSWLMRKDEDEVGGEGASKDVLMTGV